VGVMTIRKSVVFLFLACAIALVISSSLLASRLARLQRLDDLLNKSNRLQAGETVPPLVGYDLTGKQVRYAYGITDQRDTLLLVLSPTCHACEYNWPNWTQMIRKLNGQKTRLLIANIAAGSALTTDYLAKHQVAADNVIAEVSAESIQAYKLGYTPQTILIAPDGKVVRVHTGMLKEGDLDVHGAAAPPQNSKVQSSGFEGVLALSIFLGAFELG
jgi:hypothetical protein